LRKVLFFCLVSLFLPLAHIDGPKKESELNPNNRIAKIKDGIFCCYETRLPWRDNIVRGDSCFFCCQKNVPELENLSAVYFGGKRSRSFQNVFLIKNPSLCRQTGESDSENWFSDSKNEFEDEVESASKNNDVRKELIEAVIDVESSGDVFAKSKSGAEGLMQLKPQTQKEMSVDNPYDPAENIEGGTKYLKKMCDRFGSVEMGLAAYRIGPGKLSRKIKKGGRKVPPEARKYVNKVMAVYKNNV